jgi:2Fe-2S ferredoxin
MPTVYVIDRDGKRHTVSAEDDMPLMFALRDAALPVEATCGGTASCGTCHVFVADAWVDRLPARDTMELDMLSELQHFNEKSSRLSCQLSTTAELEGLEVRLAPEEFV